jgi:hypothetical protein
MRGFMLSGMAQDAMRRRNDVWLHGRTVEAGGTLRGIGSLMGGKGAGAMRWIGILIAGFLCVGAGGSPKAVREGKGAATRPMQTTWYLKGEEIFGNREAAEKGREAAELERKWGGDSRSRGKVVKAYEEAISLQPGAAINAALAGRIAGMYAFSPDAARGASDPEKAKAWWKKAQAWAEPGTVLFYESMFRVAEAEKSKEVGIFQRIIEVDEKKMAWPSWRVMKGEIRGEMEDGWLVSQPEAEGSAFYEAEMRPVREELGRLQLKAAERIGLIVEAKHEMNDPRVSNQRVRSELKEWAKRYEGREVGRWFEQRWREFGGEHGW